ncbi:transaldolase [Sphaceloma murrayae]|uniref:Transaldolase n=1 Tax=Sphaceloma murrayae TaxID=2082308 RepID=A0A2K1QWT6_9PEZI|nr:transaldolase [Sphaceloma murrayae]
MAALRSPLAPSPTPSSKVVQATPSPTSPALQMEALSPRSAHSLAPPSPYPQHVDPSPTESNGTDTTEIEEDAQEEISEKEVIGSLAGMDARGVLPGGSAITSPISPNDLAKLDTTVKRTPEPHSDDAPTSVIHVSQGFKHFASERQSPSSSHSRDMAKVETWIASPSTPDAAKGPDDKRLSGQSPGPSNGSTETISSEAPKPIRQDSVTDRSSTSSRSRSALSAQSVLTAPRASGSIDLHIINVDGDLACSESVRSSSDVSEEVKGLRRALANCWSLCNTLADMSNSYRHRVFFNSPKSTIQDTAWNSCWRLCQELYNYRNQPFANIDKSIELCRDFTNAWFEARSKGDSTSDSILRVSFEMSTHLYNIRDRTLPAPFVKRSMDFYVAFCHRMMKQRSSLPRETDALLHACWTLAESLYNLQHHRDDNEEDITEEEVLTSALHAAFGLSDLLKESWSHGRSNDRGTPRPVQHSFPPRNTRALPSEGRTSSMSNRTYHDATSSFQNGFAPPHGHAPPLPPETPVTIFDDVTDSSSPESATAPKILVLGPADSGAGRARLTQQSQYAGSGAQQHQARQGSARQQQRGDSHLARWSSNASSLSDFSESNGQSEAEEGEWADRQERHVEVLKGLLVQAGEKVGFGSVMSGRKAGTTADTQAAAASEGAAEEEEEEEEGEQEQTLQSFVAGLGADAFGADEQRKSLLVRYKGLVTTDPTLRGVRAAVRETFTVEDMAEAVNWLVGGDERRWSWMGSLFRFVTGMEEVGEGGQVRMAQ